MERAALLVWRDEVQPQWLDYNGHMNEAFYLLVFSRATDLLLDRIGVDASYRAATSCSVYTAETHLCYLREVGAGTGLLVRVRLLNFDEKRLHVWSEMLREGTGDLLCTAEMTMVHVDTSVPKAAPFADEVVRRVEALYADQLDLPWPERAGRAIRRLG